MSKPKQYNSLIVKKPRCTGMSEYIINQMVDNIKMRLIIGNKLKQCIKT